MSHPLDPDLVLRGYAAGIFPMADDRASDDLFWVEPRTRAVLPPDRFHLSRSLAKRLRSGRFTVTADRDFAAVLLGCADRPQTWINGPIEAAMLALHASAPGVLNHCLAGHVSAEPGHRRVLDHLDLRPILALDLRLGEGTGALAALPLLEVACRAATDVATFDEWFAQHPVLPTTV